MILIKSLVKESKKYIQLKFIIYTNYYHLDYRRTVKFMLIKIYNILTITILVLLQVKNSPT